MEFKDLDKIAYKEAWDLQKELVDLRAKGTAKDTVLLCEHNPVYTFGKSANRENLLINDVFLKNIGAEKYEIERGGDITFHGPGQLVGYPILNLHELGIGVKRYVEVLEESIINTLRHFGIETERIDGLTGIWITKGIHRKVAAIGIKVSRGITMHGFALNVNTDLSFFRHMIPCGISDKDVTTMAVELGHEVNMDEVKSVFKTEFAKALYVD